MEIKYLDKEGLIQIFNIINKKDKQLESDITEILNGMYQKITDLEELVKSYHNGEEPKPIEYNLVGSFSDDATDEERYFYINGEYIYLDKDFAINYDKPVISLGLYDEFSNGDGSVSCFSPKLKTLEKFPDISFVNDLSCLMVNNTEMEELDLSSWNVSNVRNRQFDFITNRYAGSNGWVIPKSKLKKLNLSGWKLNSSVRFDNQAMNLNNLSEIIIYASDESTRSEIKTLFNLSLYSTNGKFIYGDPTGQKKLAGKEFTKVEGDYNVTYDYYTYEYKDPITEETWWEVSDETEEIRRKPLEKNLTVTLSDGWVIDKEAKDVPEGYTLFKVLDTTGGKKHKLSISFSDLSSLELQGKVWYMFGESIYFGRVDAELTTDMQSWEYYSYSEKYVSNTNWESVKYSFNESEHHIDIVAIMQDRELEGWIQESWEMEGKPAFACVAVPTALIKEVIGGTPDEPNPVEKNLTVTLSDGWVIDKEAKDVPEGYTLFKVTDLMGLRNHKLSLSFSNLSSLVLQGKIWMDFCYDVAFGKVDTELTTDMQLWDLDASYVQNDLMNEQWGKVEYTFNESEHHIDIIAYMHDTNLGDLQNHWEMMGKPAFACVAVPTELITEVVNE